MRRIIIPLSVILLAVPLLVAVPTTAKPSPPTRPADEMAEIRATVDRLQKEVAELRAEVASLRAAVIRSTTAPADRAAAGDRKRIEAAIARREIVVGMTKDEAEESVEAMGLARTNNASTRMVRGELVESEYWYFPNGRLRSVSIERGVVTAVGTRD